MNATHHKSNDTFTLTLSSEELNAILCAFDELEKVKYCRIEGHEKSPFAIGAKKLHSELTELYTEQ
jgi:hypothetical protein